MICVFERLRGEAESYKAAGRVRDVDIDLPDILGRAGAEPSATDIPAGTDAPAETQIGPADTGSGTGPEGIEAQTGPADTGSVTVPEGTETQTDPEPGPPGTEDLTEPQPEAPGTETAAS